MITQGEFENEIKRFGVVEDLRDKLWDKARILLENGYEIEAYFLILGTWNFLGFRHVIKNCNLNEFQNTLNDINPIFDKMKDENFETANLDLLENDISFIYNKFKKLVGQTGATKLMALKNPKLFVMWDTGIRKLYSKKYSISQACTSDDYLNFLKGVKKEFSDIKWEDKDKPFAKALDEFNFIVTQKRNNTR